MRRWRAALALTLAAAAIAACGSGGRAVAKPAQSGASGWAAFGGTSDGHRRSALRQVNRGTVRRLGIAWTLTEDPRFGALWETFPVVAGDTMYLTTNTGTVLALDARTGRERWRYVPQIDFIAGGGAEVSPTDRGVAIGGGLVYALTFDERLIALRAGTGRVVWTATVADPRHGYQGTSPPTYADGVLYVGSAGSDAVRTRGFVAAYDARSGRRRWRALVGPPGGGGRVWMPPTYDRVTQTVYAGTGNPSPAIAPRRGCPHWASGVVALDARSGRIRWGADEVCSDTWDYDGGQPPLVYNARRGGQTVRVIAHANKSGRFTLRRAADGRVLGPSVALVPVSAPRPSANGVRVCPGALGGVAYSPAALDPEARLLYQPVARVCMRYRAGATQPDGPHVALGGGNAVIDRSTPVGGELVAVDADTGRVRWRRAVGAPMVGGALATAGGLVFSPADDGVLYAFDAQSGRIVWRGRIGLAFGSAPLTYRVGKTQYVAIVAGGSSLAPLVGARTGARLVVLRLGGRALS